MYIYPKLQLILGCGVQVVYIVHHLKDGSSRPCSGQRESSIINTCCFLSKSTRQIVSFVFYSVLLIPFYSKVA